MERPTFPTPEAERRANLRQPYMFMVPSEQIEQIKSLAIVEDVTMAAIVREALDEYISRQVSDPAYIQWAIAEWNTPLPDEQPVTVKLARSCFTQLRHISAMENESRDKVLETAIEEYYHTRVNDEAFAKRARQRLDELHREEGMESAGEGTEL